MIEAEGLTKLFGRRRALDGVDLRIADGEAVAVYGPNGAGKTTLVRLLTLGLRPSSGSLRIAGFDPERDDVEIRKRVGWISHQSLLYEDLTARENLEFFGGLYGVPRRRERADELLKSVDLVSRADDPVRTLSRGMRQRLSVVRALVHEPPLVLLDEPFTGLDAHAATRLREQLQRLRHAGRTLLLVTHDLAQGLELTDRWLLFAEGKLLTEGPSSETDATRFRELYFERLASRRAARVGP